MLGVELPAGSGEAAHSRMLTPRFNLVLFLWPCFTECCLLLDGPSLAALCGESIRKGLSLTSSAQDQLVFCFLLGDLAFP